ncbi:DNA repair protein RAD51 homolog 3 [Lolium perenne]|uniref:DNA repair protein RAD51 homolog 3 n=1 Tax=Lolium perenne TaxID=4522 RepID=UPI0021F5D0B5|nr:DNA repair protein RAD51 homolog 3 [Lolium perenne]
MKNEIQESVGILKADKGANKFKGAEEPSGVLKGAQNAWDMLSEEQLQKHISTGSSDLNGILGGGIHCKEVTEIGGVPGVGKTQLGIQLAINVQIPMDYGGLGGKAVYIDTEGSFMVERVYQIAEGCISDIMEYFPYHHDKSSSGQGNLQPERFLAGIYYFRICSYTEQIAVINYLEKFLGEHKDVRIVIIDSVTFHFRQDFDDLALRTRVLSGLSLKLMKLSKTYNLAVVLLNQVTTKFTEGSFQLTLALGDSWSHSCTNRLILYWKGNERCAYLDKSPSLPVASTPYAVTSKGVRDAATPNCKRVRIM